MKIALIGDSHTQAYFPTLKTLLETANHQVVGQLSKIGWATYSFNKDPSLIASVLQQDPDVVLVSLGGNNGRLSDEGYRSAVGEFLENVGYPQRRVIWVGPAIATRSDVDTRHRWTANWFRNNLPKDILFIDAEEFTNQGHSSDGVHFKMSFYKDVWAKTVADKVLPALNLPLVLYKAQQNLPLILLIIALGGLGFVSWRRYASS